MKMEKRINVRSINSAAMGGLFTSAAYLAKSGLEGNLLDAWREAPIYSEREQAALAWAEAVVIIWTNPLREIKLVPFIWRQGSPTGIAGKRTHPENGNRSSTITICCCK